MKAKWLVFKKGPSPCPLPEYRERVKRGSDRSGSFFKAGAVVFGFALAAVFVYVFELVVNVAVVFDDFGNAFDADAFVVFAHGSDGFWWHGGEGDFLFADAVELFRIVGFAAGGDGNGECESERCCSHLSSLGGPIIAGDGSRGAGRDRT